MIMERANKSMLVDLTMPTAADPASAAGPAQWGRVVTRKTIVGHCQSTLVCRSQDSRALSPGSWSASRLSYITYTATLHTQPSSHHICTSGTGAVKHTSKWTAAGDGKSALYQQQWHEIICQYSKLCLWRMRDIIDT